MDKKVKEIYEGWKNLLIPDEEIEMIAKTRIDICNACPFKQEMLLIDCCSLCHCPIVSKARSLDSECPKGFWESKNNKK